MIHSIQSLCQRAIRSAILSTLSEKSTEMGDLEAWKRECIDSHKAKGMAGFCWDWLDGGQCDDDSCTNKHEYPETWTEATKNAHRALLLRTEASYEDSEASYCYTHGANHGSKGCTCIQCEGSDTWSR